MVKMFQKEDKDRLDFGMFLRLHRNAATLHDFMQLSFLL